ncbi:UDP-N-acetylmuramoyl-L-alanine--D-glutamate ligase [Mammaliicoccus stepanovicii]|uniref:UDP-N-acetylmuramoylalanine--D-glutamate ligase n=1 Tax=Mammaliicoccus stepanovicii TaxID=643214 RepID=A0A239ZKZ3_9STAP|nr:UDP-N-acetylmuramoyl-L-alanine--D-glutamate ligase [Mammaliicoccus stepanovicii]PNZ77914.1 UDP-N-acetylmuramoyl-L-alanine--D-glutamate ligase [Mammaliicoccus stepanovicii]GGI41607.1 UDP-N-acetylmuramoylalanine--D-glutamate ligase [Mammaliicoccus stepanovicii]SNV71637.1 UDP-N-acetylmuramoyl-L-alanyl-D-glutamate synthetase [Mammaliicoccus stepanovicii]
MKEFDALKGKDVLILGLAKSGYESAKLCQKLGANVIVNDGKDLTSDPHASELMSQGIKVISGEHPLYLLDNNPLIVKNPGIPYSIQLLVEAENRNLDIITEVELSYYISEAPIIGITGTNGKTTVTSLIGDMFGNSKVNGQVSGNIGVVASKVAQEVNKEDYLITELSSFQLLGTIKYRPHIAIVTNIYSAHLDYHGSLEEYQKAKKNIFQNQTEEDYLIFNFEQRHLIDKEQIKSKILYFSTEQEVDGIYIKDDYVVYNNIRIIHVNDIVLPGKHNLENVLVAVLASIISGVEIKSIVHTLTTFSGIKHRLQFVGNNRGNKYFNDSKATNTLATRFALSSFNSPIIWLCGGLDRGNDFDDLIPYMDNVRLMVTFGETKDKLKTLGLTQGKEVLQVTDVKDAVDTIQDYIQPNDVVLLSPACASWDQYDTFEARGNEFIESFQKHLPTF